MSEYPCQHFPCKWPDCACEPEEEDDYEASIKNMSRKEALSWQKARDADVD